MEINPLHDPSLPDAGFNAKMMPSYSISGPIDTVKEEINGWSLGKLLHDKGFIKLTNEEYIEVEGNIKMYEKELQKIYDVKEDK